MVYAAPAFRPRLASRNTALDVRCARKPMRLSATKKKAKKEEGDARRSRQREKQGLVEGTGDGGITPAQRVKAAQHEARRWLGQHFLIDQSVILDAVAAAEIASGDRILEIGPGTGNLTVELLKQGARIVAVEKDRSLADKLTVQFGNDEKHEIEIHNADFLKWDVVSRFARIADEVEVEVEEYAPVSSDAETNHINPTKPKPLTPNPKPTDRRAKVVANIPYNITSDILKVLLPMGASFSNMVFMFQEEVAQRLLRDEPGQSDYRPMSVRVHYYSTPYYIRKVDAVCFDPPPAVTSCLIGFKPRRPEEYLPLSGTEKQFFSFVTACFAQKRKMLKNNLKAVCDDATITEALEMLGKPENTRAQDLSMPQYVALFNFVRDAGQAKAGVLSAPRVNNSAVKNQTPKKQTVSQREAAVKVQRATSRLIQQARGDGSSTSTSTSEECAK